jgi:hypothetical protein
MSWKQRFTESTGDIMRFVAYGCLIIDGILLSIFSVWFVSEFLWHLLKWLDRVIFDKPW